MNLLLKNAMLVTPDEIKKRNVLIKNKVIEKISGDEIECGSETEIIDICGNYISAGFIDLHSHLRDPGYTHKEDIKSGTKSAVKGGFTTVLCMPNTKPSIDNAETIEEIYGKSKCGGYCNVLSVGAITLSQEGKVLTDFALLKKAGAIALSDDGKPVGSSALMREAFIKAKENDMLIISHCEDLELVQADYVSNSAEDVITARDIILAGETGARLHIAHVSSGNSVDFIEWAKNKGYRITAETCPHYFSLTDRDAEKIGVNAKMNPPLRSGKDREKIIESIKGGIIDCISTDHAPHAYYEKCEETNDWQKAMNGITGFETAFAVGVTYLVKPGIISLNKLINLMTANPAKIIGIDSMKGQLEEGMSADIAVFSTDEKYIYDRAKTYSKSKNTPYDGFELYGKILYTIVNGKITI